MYKNENRVEYITTDNMKIALEYFSLKTNRIQKKIKGKRETIVWNDYTEKIDEVKTFRALRANIIHSLDGTLVRQISCKLVKPIITIHDSYGIDILQIEELVEIARREYEFLSEHHKVILSENTKISIKSNFILL